MSAEQVDRRVRRSAGRPDRSGPRLLHSKLAVARPRPEALSRSRLVDRLRSVAVPGRVVLVVAGAGWGKSTAVASWIDAEGSAQRCVWFSADPGDDDAARFWGHLLAGLGNVEPGAFAESARLLQTPGTDVVGEVVPALTNELCALDGPVTVVVDDYHLIDSGEVHRGVGVLLERLPATLRLVLVSRVEPPLPLTRLRGQGRLAEIGVAELRLSAAETAELLARETGAVLDARAVEQLHQRTEGWVAGAHLAALSLRSHPGDVATVIAEWGRGDRRLGEYLMAEVLTRVPDDLRLLLRRASILDRFCPALCDAMTGRSDSTELLARAERDQLFLIPLDGRGEWYRYHHLFAEVLRRDLDRAEADEVPHLHRRAAAWFADHDLPVEAVHHALRSGDRALATNLVAVHAPLVAGRGYLSTALGWFDRLGEDVCRADPRLCLAQTAVAGRASRVGEMMRWADLAQAAAAGPGVSADVVRQVQFRVAAVRWAAATFHGDAPAARAAADDVLALSVEGTPRSSFIPVAMLGLNHYRAGSLQQAHDLLAQGRPTAAERHDHATTVLIGGVQAVIAARRGFGHEAERFAQDVETLADRHGVGDHFNALYLHLARGWVHAQRGHHDAARAALGRALELARRSPLRVETAEVLTALASAEFQLGHTRAAQPHLDEARRLIATCPDPGVLALDPRTVRFPVVGPTSGPGPTPAAGLSAREIQVLVLLADGLTNEQIGTELAVSRRTVDAHLRRIYPKIDAKTRAAAIRYALDHGLTAPTVARN